MRLLYQMIVVIVVLVRTVVMHVILVYYFNVIVLHRVLEFIKLASLLCNSIIIDLFESIYINKKRIE